MESLIKKFLQQNRHWACEKQHDDPAYFEKLAEGQKPVALLVGCSDSRVSPSLVLGGDLGELFIHRNIANVISHSDLNFLSVMQYAIEVLEIQHIIVKGHYGCGGVKAAMQDEAYSLIDNWLVNIKDVIEQHQSELDQILDGQERFNRLVEINVEVQIENLKHTSVYRNAIKAGRKLYLHGWVYDFSTGLIKVLKTDEPGVWEDVLATEPECTALS